MPEETAALFTEDGWLRTGDLGALAFDLRWAPSGQDARWVVSNARGVGRLHVPLAQALRVAETLFGGLAERRGRLVVRGDYGTWPIAPLFDATSTEPARHAAWTKLKAFVAVWGRERG